MSVQAAAVDGRIVSKSEERWVIFASSLGTVFEWYDFYLYAILAPTFAALFFPKGNDTAALLSAFATYAAGFLVRPFGAVVFGRIGDLVGRKYTFLITIFVMGASTFAVGLLPTLRACRHPGPDLAGHAPAAAGPRARRRIWRCGHLCGGACSRARPRLLDQLDPDDGHGGLVACSVVIFLCRNHWAPMNSRPGAGAFRSGCRSSCSASRSISGYA